jgi:hypothetical protein
VPELSRFFGIVIAMYFRDHPPPHFHARYGEHHAKFAIGSGALLEGTMPRRATKFVQEWHAMHVDELRSAWDAVQSRRLPNKIEPLE